MTAIKTVYESKAFTLDEWTVQQTVLTQEGFEYVDTTLGVVYIRKMLQGPPAPLDQEEWRLWFRNL